MRSNRNNLNISFVNTFCFRESEYSSMLLLVIAISCVPSLEYSVYTHTFINIYAHSVIRLIINYMHDGMDWRQGVLYNRLIIIIRLVLRGKVV